jgi:hypothetical protein
MNSYLSLFHRLILKKMISRRQIQKINIIIKEFTEIKKKVKNLIISKTPLSNHSLPHVTINLHHLHLHHLPPPMMKKKNNKKMNYLHLPLPHKILPKITKKSKLNKIKNLPLLNSRILN